MVDGSRSDKDIVAWERARCRVQPYEDHRLPLMVGAGAASGEPSRIVFHGRVLGELISGFRFG